MTYIEDGAVVLFQGDSITDAGRDRSQGDSLGSGYALMAAAQFGRKHPLKDVKFLNRGIGGDRVVDLASRWEEDCLELRPSWLSVYIGINDTWRRFDSGVPLSAEAYRDTYRSILERALEKNAPKLILVEPFVLPVNEGQKAWREDLDPKIQAVRELAGEYKALYVPLDGLFAQAAAATGPAYWAPDGVHPSPAGNALIAEAWLNAVKA
ncbi:MULTISPECIES: SGNH/GDSL hydrolase family protein [unclassified Paenibacillus]|uniref:SGNH/GDSL hydrolase family protein n=1 Tax=unclassified Paenibacillus TaxID=185978 RepID=UPI0009557BF0|nr:MULTISPECIES: SGNH/GDSL hydrolase family protein [unclassified Paenibacillus]ASS65815.1 SGNH/GDSL hydrolase family protein [Paenibacillus sp. RUD330]SIQ22684.1 Lysophospholipase L1 [Paenibacillus sp. RU4X]SIQ44364.1 Lysophospholipase L1 [Paenibacillus sp. RU4T]